MLHGPAVSLGMTKMVTALGLVPANISPEVVRDAPHNSQEDLVEK